MVTEPSILALCLRTSAIVLAGACLAACGRDDGRGGPYGDLPSCEDYCQRLRTSDGGCGFEAEDCPRDCELWRREHSDMGCELAFDDLLACTAGTDEVCMSI